MTDEELAEIEATWSATSGTRWRTEKHDASPANSSTAYVKLYAVMPPNMHDAYLLDLSDGDANYENNLAAIAKAPEHVAALIAKVKTLRVVAEASPLTLEVRAIVEDKLGQMGKLMAPLKWSGEFSTVDGVYWMREMGSPYKGERDGMLVQVSVEDRDTPRMHYFGVSGGDGIARMVPREWAGPLVRP